jgi:hypothetical protein
VWILHQTKVMKEILAREGFGSDSVGDLFYVNYKGIDHVGHRWNMLNPESRAMTRYTDAELPKLLAWLDRVVGPNRWVVALTSDHGQSPLPRRVGAWPLGEAELKNDIRARFDVDADQLVQAARPAGLWLRRDVLEDAGIALGEMSNFLLDYALGDNVAEGMEVPPEYDAKMDQRLIRAAWPAVRTQEVWTCAQRRDQRARRG